MFNRKRREGCGAKRRTNLLDRLDVVLTATCIVRWYIIYMYFRSPQEKKPSLQPQKMLPFSFSLFPSIGYI